jgi:hypothetical protein
VSKKKLDLLQFPSGGAAEPSATSSEIVRRQFANADLRGELLFDVPNDLFRHSFAPNPSGAAYTPEETTSLDFSRRCQGIQKTGHPPGNRDGSNVTGLPTEVNNSPMPFALLKMVNGQHRQFVAATARRRAKAQEAPDPVYPSSAAVGRLPQSVPLLGCQPVAKPYS